MLAEQGTNTPHSVSYPQCLHQSFEISLLFRLELHIAPLVCVGAPTTIWYAGHRALAEPPRSPTSPPPQEIHLPTEYIPLLPRGTSQICARFWGPRISRSQREVCQHLRAHSEDQKASLPLRPPLFLSNAQAKLRGLT